ncbi:homogentisate phytyltransferase 1, chloroplastic-like [Dorcoceras hygrometricum]|uniref:Homogentisate phytyltransferase 1, chloroplastic-like n=1 Tax=Dorcoceras hygrometricum TaxID=472368 RepID=A0A2Z7CPR3_9LAMI|nr:homogentisate phytyltransferase 1, chloroplastic-like [Dorcoceras hygrometricum]
MAARRRAKRGISCNAVRQAWRIDCAPPCNDLRATAGHSRPPCAASADNARGGDRQPAIEGLTNLAWTETPRNADRNKSDHGKRRRMAAALKVADGGVARGGEGAAKLGLGL